MGMTIDETIKRFQRNAEYERTHGSLQGCLEFRQLAEWLRRYQKIEEIVNTWHHDIEAKDFECMAEIADVVEDGNDDFVKEHKHE